MSFSTLFTRLVCGVYYFPSIQNGINISMYVLFFAFFQTVSPDVIQAGLAGSTAKASELLSSMGSNGVYG